jgi:hypothetical protein
MFSPYQARQKYLARNIALGEKMIEESTKARETRSMKAVITTAIMKFTRLILSPIRFVRKAAFLGRVSIVFTKRWGISINESLVHSEVTAGSHALTA